jgi:hypothetical protein
VLLNVGFRAKSRHRPDKRTGLLMTHLNVGLMMSGQTTDGIFSDHELVRLNP